MVEALLRDGFGYHAAESDRYAAELEAAAEAGVPAAHLAQFLKDATHTIGEHLGDWRRATKIAEQVLEGRSPTKDSAKAWAHLAIARMMSGDVARAAAAELTYLSAADGDFEAALIEGRFMLVATLVGCKRAADASAIYVAALELARKLGDAAPSRAMAVASNNLASELLEVSTRTAEEAALMRLCADTAHEFWLRCGTWQHDERARYLKALVANALGEPDAALGHVETALQIIAANGEAPVDVNFLHLTRAHALRLAGDEAASVDELAISDTVAAGWTNPGLTAWYAEERVRVIGAPPPSAVA
ncbi:MAG TPA: hypothetical protein VGI95_07495 [Caulobacteraceae bacterium]|jgi:tetratricopeptide (TPR) repeat protein